MISDNAEEKSVLPKKELFFNKFISQPRMFKSIESVYDVRIFADIIAIKGTLAVFLYKKTKTIDNDEIV